MGTRSTTQALQRGSALIVSLVMLLLLTLIGVAGMKDTLLQEKMVGNVRDREIALQAAESALRAAETSLGLPTALNITNNNGLYNLNPPKNAGDPPVRAPRRKRNSGATGHGRLPILWNTRAHWMVCRHHRVT